MSEKLNVITGATGLLGSHIAEQLVARGERVCALVRHASDTRFLRELGVEMAFGDLHDPDALAFAFSGADTVYHCAAKVGDWGPWRQFQRDIIQATANVLEACRKENVRRILYVSSITVYGRPPGNGPITEDTPLGQDLRRWEKYARSKIEAEKLCRQHPGEVTIIRPSWVYGPRDRNTLPRLANGLKVGRIGLIDGGRHLLNIVYAGDVADGAIRAATSPRAAGQAYNLCSPGEITQKEWLDMVAAHLGLPAVERSVPLRTAYRLGLLSEIIGKVIRLRRSPYVTRYGVGIMTRPTRYSSEKAKRELDWQIRTPAREGMRRALEWLAQAGVGVT